MIQRISFGSKYVFTDSSDNHKRYPSAVVTSVSYANLMHLNNEDKISISKEKDGFGVEVPKYMDKDIETYCLFSGIKYIKH